MDQLPPEMIGHIISQITNIHDILALWNINTIFRILTSESISMIDSDNEIRVDIFIISRFKRIKELHNIIIQLSSKQELITLLERKYLTPTNVYLRYNYEKTEFDSFISTFWEHYFIDQKRQFMFMFPNHGFLFIDNTTMWTGGKNDEFWVVKKITYVNNRIQVSDIYPGGISYSIFNPRLKNYTIANVVDKLRASNNRLKNLPLRLSDLVL